MSAQERIREQPSIHTGMVVRARRARSRTARAFGIAGLLLALGCVKEATAPGDTGTLSFVVVSGDGQSGVVGTELAQPLVIKATKSNGAVLSGVTVAFRVTSGGGSMWAGVATTDAKGIAEDYWTLGTLTAEAQRVEVRAVLSTGQKQVYGVFTATPLAGPATQIVLQAGDGQTANAASNVPIAPAVLVSDQYGNTVPGWSVTFAVASGGGSVTGGNATTDASGIATVGSWTLGPAGGNNTLTATASGSGVTGNPVTFMATGVGDFWTRRRGSMPTARFEMGAAAINGILYVAGGSNGSSNLGTLEAYDPATDRWTTKGSMPTPNSGLRAVAVNGILYMIGGPTAMAYDPTTDTWTTKTARMPTPRTLLGVAAINGIIYAVGGKAAGGAGTVIEAYDPATDTWTGKLAAMPTERVELSVAAINGVLYAVGGRSSAGGFATTIDAYDPATNTWTTKAPIPTVRTGLSVVAINGILYALGGLNDLTGQTPLATLEAYDPATDVWTTKASMPTARYSFGVAAINGTLYAVGGIGAFASILSTVEAYQP